MIKSRQMKGAVHTAHMGDNEKQLKVLVGKHKATLLFEVLDIH